MSEEKKEYEDLNIPFSRKQKAEIQPQTKQRKSFHIPAPAWFAIGCAVMIAAALIGFRIRDSVLGEQVVLLDASVPSFTGYSGGGTLNGEFSPEKAAVEKLQNMVEERKAKGRSTDSLVRLIDSISCGFDRDSGYSNNENLIYACSYDADAAEQAGIRLSNETKAYTVSGLAEYQVLDVFSGVSAQWQFNDSGLYVEVYAPQEYLDMGIDYVTDYDELTYNNETVSIHSEFDQNVLRSYGYVVETDDMTYPLGPKPEAITDAETLSEEEKEALKQQMQAVLENELTGCNYRAALHALTGTYSIEITGIERADIQTDPVSYFNEAPLFRITYVLSTNSESLISSYGSFDAHYTGRIYRMADGSIRFLTNTVHACEFSGWFGMYSLKEDGE